MGIVIERYAGLTSVYSNFSNTYFTTTEIPTDQSSRPFAETVFMFDEYVQIIDVTVIVVMMHMAPYHNMRAKFKLNG